MYQNDLFERLRGGNGRGNSGGWTAKISPTVWALGITSFLTDISSEMVTSVLPVFLFNYLRLSPVQFGVVDAVYNGLSVALIAIAFGVLADRTRRHKLVAVAGYGLSSICKLLLIVAGSTWAGVMGVVGLDRLGKGIRVAPRDAMISLSTPAQNLGIAFGTHRALDSAGALLGPIAAFAFLMVAGSYAFNQLWLVSFLVALAGVAALSLLVPTKFEYEAPSESSRQPLATIVRTRGFPALLASVTLLALCTVSDAFLYLIVQQKGDIGIGYLPLFYVVTAATFMVFAVSAGKLADSHGLRRVFLLGYVILIVVYAMLLSSESLPGPVSILSLVFLGLFYAATEGVLMAMAGRSIPKECRTTGIALLLTAVGLAKFVSSIAFGWLWQGWGIDLALSAFVGACLIAVIFSYFVLARAGHG